MGNTHIGGLKLSAKAIGVSVDELLRATESGLKYCTMCKQWKTIADYNKDAARPDGVYQYCRECKNARARAHYVKKGPPPRYGPPPKPARSGDKLQAERRVQNLFHRGKIPHPNKVACSQCGHMHIEDGRLHHYHHYKGYDAEHHTTVTCLCVKCHARQPGANGAKTHCKHGHAFTPENTFIAKNGTRHCVQCRRDYDKRRGRNAAFWRTYRINRRQK